MMKTIFLFASTIAVLLMASLVFAQDTTLTITTSGKVGIGTTSPATLLDVRSGTVEITPATDGERALRVRSADRTQNAVIDVKNDQEFFVGGSGLIITLANTFGVESRFGTTWSPITASSFNTSSSRRFKTNINILDNALQKVKKLRGVIYDEKSSGKHRIGLIAEEVGEVIPEVVTYEGNGMDAKSLDYSRLVALLIEAIKEQQKQIDELKKTMKSMTELQ